MPNPGTLAPPEAPSEKPGRQAAAQAQVAANPFVRASREVTETFHDRGTQMAAGPVAVDDVEVPPFGFLRNIIISVEATGGAAGAAVVAAREDAPWNVLQDVQLLDTNGRPLVGPVTGFDLFLKEKWLPGSSFDSNPANLPSFSGVDANGNFSLELVVPVEVSLRDALGALPNQNASSEYRFGYKIAGSGDVYAVAPAGALPTIRVRCHMEAWAPADPVDPRGVPNMVEPPAVGTTQHLIKSLPVIQAGEQRVRFTRVGNMIRGWILVLRNNANPRLRTTVDFPELIRLEWDQKNLAVMRRDYLRNLMRKRSGYAPDTGVLVIDFAHDLDGRVGNEMRDQWLPTSSATRLELVGNFGANAGALQIITNDVAPAGAGV
jgi:hypothetical protein